MAKKQSTEGLEDRIAGLESELSDAYQRIEELSSEVELLKFNLQDEERRYNDLMKAYDSLRNSIV